MTEFMIEQTTCSFTLRWIFWHQIPTPKPHPQTRVKWFEWWGWWGLSKSHDSKVLMYDSVGVQNLHQWYGWLIHWVSKETNFCRAMLIRIRCIPPGTIPHRIKVKPIYCPSGPRSVGLLPLGQLPTRTAIRRTTPH